MCGLFNRNDEEMVSLLEMNGTGVHFRFLSPSRFAVAEVNSGGWRHLCVTWQEDGEWTVYLDGRVKDAGIGGGSLPTR